MNCFFGEGAVGVVGVAEMFVDFYVRAMLLEVWDAEDMVVVPVGEDACFYLDVLSGVLEDTMQTVPPRIEALCSVYQDSFLSTTEEVCVGALKSKLAGVTAEDSPDVGAYLFHLGDGRDVDSHEVSSSFPVYTSEDLEVLGRVCGEEVGGVSGVAPEDAFVGVGGRVGKWSWYHTGLRLYRGFGLK